jgi:hypothetical protein
MMFLCGLFLFVCCYYAGFKGFAFGILAIGVCYAFPLYVFAGVSYLKDALLQGLK